MKDDCIECGEEFHIKEMVPQYMPELNNGMGASVWFCNRCFFKLNVEIEGKPSYMLAPGVKNFNYAPEDVIRDVCYYFKIKEHEIKNKGRSRRVVTPRQVCTYFIKLKFGDKFNLTEISQFFGKKDHSLVIHSIKMVENDMVTDSNYRKMINDIAKIIDSHIINQNSVSELKY